MASQNCDPAAASVVVARKGAEPSGGAARGPVGKRLQQELMTFMMSGDKGISAFPESDNLFKRVGTIHGAAGTMCHHPDFIVPFIEQKQSRFSIIFKGPRIFIMAKQH
uniref:UBC core domain-containing protein n=1 Tax=Propithecus coquereli TaxID=379532 RepID=A0A2K6GLS5_PROCO